MLTAASRGPRAAPRWECGEQGRETVPVRTGPARPGAGGGRQEDGASAFGEGV